jgi:hypothetical protein
VFAVRKWAACCLHSPLDKEVRYSVSGTITDMDQS